MKSDPRAFHFFFVVRRLADSHNMNNIVLLTLPQVKVEIALLWGIHDQEAQVLEFDQGWLVNDAVLRKRGHFFEDAIQQ